MIKILYILIVMLLQIGYIAQADMLIYDPPMKELKTVGYFSSGDTINKPSCPSRMDPAITVNVAGVAGSTDGANSYPITAFQGFAEHVNCSGGAPIQGGYYDASNNLISATYAGLPLEYQLPTPEGRALFATLHYIADGSNCTAWKVRGNVSDLNNGTTEGATAIKLNVFTLCCPSGSDNCE